MKGIDAADNALTQAKTELNAAIAKKDRKAETDIKLQMGKSYVNYRRDLIKKIMENPYSFANINAHEFLFVTKYAADIYRHHKDVWDKIIEAGMKGDYSWKKSAGEYAGLYSLITGIPRIDASPAKEAKKEPAEKKEAAPEKKAEK